MSRLQRGLSGLSQNGLSRLGASQTGLERQGSKSFEELKRLIHGKLVDKLDLSRVGALEVLLKDPTISDILVNGPHKVYVERRGKMEKTDVKFRDNDHLLQIIDRIVSKVGRRVDETSPMVDARLPDGSRVNAIIPPLALDGP